jgi:hypothetical protein
MRRLCVGDEVDNMLSLLNIRSVHAESFENIFKKSWKALER